MSETKSGGMNPALKIILIVVAILAVLGCGGIVVMYALVRSNVDTYMKKADRVMTQTQMREIEHMITSYRLDNSALPPDLDALVGEYLAATAVPPDAWGNRFIYIPAEDGKAYELISLGADGAEGGEGDDADIYRDDLRR